MTTSNQTGSESERAVAIPAPVQDFISRRVSRFKNEPEPFYGRTELLQVLDERIRMTVRAGESCGIPPVEILLAAPGAGKTAVLTELAVRLRTDDIAVLRVKASDIATPAAFDAAVRGEPPWQDLEPFVQLDEALSDVQFGVAAPEAEAALQQALDRLGVPTVVKNLDELSTVIGHWRAGTVPDALDLLCVAQHGRPGGFALFIDEVQDLAQQGAGDESYDHVRRIIDTLSRPSDRLRTGLTKTALVLAGSAGALSVLDACHLPVYDMSWTMLPPLARRHVEKMVANGIAVGATGDEELMERAKAQWLTEIADRYGDWTGHAKAGALAVEDLLKKFTREVVEAPWGTVALHSAVAQSRNEMFHGVIGRTKGDWNNPGVSPELIDLVVWALACNGNRVDRSSLRDVIEAGLGTLLSPGKFAGAGDRDVTEAECGRIIRCMLRTGLLDSTGHLPHEPDQTPAAYYCPIPGLLDHALTEVGISRETMDEVLAGEGLAHGEVTPTAERFRPTWPDDDS